MQFCKTIAAPFFATALLFAASVPASAAGSPDKPADQMSKKLGAPVVTVSHPGGGAIGYTYVHNTTPDG